ncbi:hypothetical protein E2C01_001804 [Portunus trituberculatus]|uniref:Uncharacterized protein n=1 Tax=Portunus trituberculatus TaxID=210409 RepID=A0A5B7CK79_PORTR|nr:hypothetical protein [Portunus trituberculatus]
MKDDLASRTLKNGRGSIRGIENLGKLILRGGGGAVGVLSGGCFHLGFNRTLGRKDESDGSGSFQSVIGREKTVL